MIPVANNIVRQPQSRMMNNVLAGLGAVLKADVGDGATPEGTSGLIRERNFSEH
jgi:hypothetical protein